MFYNEPIGFASVKLSAMCANGGGQFTFDLLFGVKIVGTLTIHTKYVPYQLIRSSKAKENSKTAEEEARAQEENYNKAEQEGFETKTKQLESEIIELKEKQVELAEYNTKKESHIAKYKLISNYFSGNNKEWSSQPKDLNAIILKTESTMLEVSDYMKDGGGQGEEWPWKVMI
mmetsp:Transcript_11167/g.18766  ORF Transcript_11167/g.18766 Transcript_11167/m.18766 type:complete len:173 (+) Transcript_11167:297-815(+)|eukprot:CAMPEP_0168616560 /NCGR_PEP_ID=MMETSP0449_2-20121227/5089_1 /TAXON_ID=1082188 /ORGANISM="Strombidium rassoulzadegani, Strain ras09" /LENGTH=172 /DNA_ID=CAMNT_0008657347 /DNA_START=274 /DNA_END=792 /DNA_ORIENTATION=-